MASYINNFIEVITSKYIIKSADGNAVDVKELEGCWESINRFSKLKKPELEKLCEERDMIKTGTRAHMVARLMGLKEIPVPEKKPKKKLTKKDSKCPVIDQIIENKKFINVRKNQFDNYEHADTGLVFDEVSETVIGKQCSDGTITQLSAEDIKVCQMNMFNYVMPSNFNL